MLIVGVLVKTADQFSDTWKNENYIGVIFGVIYGLLLGYLMATSEVMATIWVGILLALILKGKFNSISHLLGIGIIIMTIIFMNDFSINFLLMLVYFIGSWLDESLNDLFDFKKMKNGIGKVIGFIAEYRLVTEIIAVSVALVLGQPAYWFGLLSFDIGYQATTKIWTKFIA